MEAYDDILSRMQKAYEAESGHAAEDVSDTGLRLRLLAGELYRLQAELAWVKRQAFPQTATGEWLDRHGEARGVVRQEARRATGKIRFSRYLPLSFDVTIPAGTVCASSGSDPVEYETTEAATLAAGELNVEVPARAVLGGPEGNISAGRITVMMAPPNGINYIVNLAPFSGGKGRESDEEYRPRALLAYGRLPNGTNAAYYRDIAMAYEGVGSAGVVPRINGAGTVGVYVWGTGGAPAANTVSGLAAELSRLREIGVTVAVQAAVAKTVDVTVRLKLHAGTEFARAAESVKQAVSSYFSGLSVGSPVYLTELERVILNAAPVQKLEFPVNMKDVAASESVIPVLGTVSVEEY